MESVYAPLIYILVFIKITVATFGLEKAVLVQSVAQSVANVTVSALGLAQYLSGKRSSFGFKLSNTYLALLLHSHVYHLESFFRREC